MSLDRRERSGELVEGVLTAQEGHQARIWTCLPGIVQSYDPNKRTAVVQPAIRALVDLPDGTSEWVQLPLLLDCPVVFPGAGNVVLTFPLAQNDECLVVFASRCIDSWWQSGGVQVQAELRMHDLSDGFCIPGPTSVPRAEPGVSTTKAQMRNRAGDTYVELDPSGQTVRLVAPSSEVKVSSGRVDVNATLYINGKAYMAHEHQNVQPGTGNSGGVINP